MFQEKLQNTWRALKTNVKDHFRFSTTEMIFILLFVNLFQTVFGPENSIVGVIFTIIMASSMVRDMTLVPGKHFIVQAFVLLGMTAAACLVDNLPPLPALLLNFAVAFLLLYTFTYEYANHLYFPYILSYLFLLFISPIGPEQLPKRLLGVLTGCAGIIIYQFVRGRHRMANETQEALTIMIDDAEQYLGRLLHGGEPADDLEAVRQNLCRLSKIVYGRRKSPLRVSDASFAMVDSGRGLEHLVLLLNEMEPPDAARTRMLERTAETVACFRAFVRRERDGLPPVLQAGFRMEARIEREVYLALCYIREHLLKMTDPERKTACRKSALSLPLRLRGALDISPVRVCYALRLAVLLAACTGLVRALALPHGKWLLFTVASVSLPYADDVGNKAKQRLLATLAGGFAAGLLFSLIPSPAGRTAVMIASGYLSFYCAGYTRTFACSTIGALGGAVFMTAFGPGPVGRMLLIRIAYVCAGILVAYAANCLVLPFRRSRATGQLWERYEKTVRILTGIVHTDEVDLQLYYNLVIQSHMMEEKLSQNAAAGGWGEMKTVIEQCRGAVRAAHRKRGAAMLSV